MEERSEIKELVIEEGYSQLIKSNETYSLKENEERSQNKMYVYLNYRGKPSEDEYASLYKDAECKDLFQELKSTKVFNNIFIFDIPSEKLYLKSNLTREYYFYYKYCTEKDIEHLKDINKELKVKVIENKDNKLKISFESPYSQEVKFNSKFSIYVSEGKKYGIFRDEKTKEAKIIEGVRDKYETEVKIDSSKKGQFVYVVAEPKDPNVSVRPKIIYKGEMIPDVDNKSDTIINAILIVLIIITFIYKFYKKRKKKAEANSSGTKLV
jgi:hypothetical protein